MLGVANGKPLENPMTGTENGSLWVGPSVARLNFHLSCHLEPELPESPKRGSPCGFLWMTSSTRPGNGLYRFQCQGPNQEWQASCRGNWYLYRVLGT